MVIQPCSYLVWTLVLLCLGNIALAVTKYLPALVDTVAHLGMHAAGRRGWYLDRDKRAGY